MLLYMLLRNVHGYPFITTTLGQAIPALVLDAVCNKTIYHAHCTVLRVFQYLYPSAKVDHYFDHHPTA